jgi:pimeloyl-ACP methyl ester carboxylesterase
VLSLARELITLIERWSPDEPVDLVGHDWGAVLTYVIAHLAPARIRAAVTLAVPHPRTFVRSLTRPAQLRHSWYMALFQVPGAGWLVRRDDFALIDRLWRSWSPGFVLDEGARRELHAMLAASMPAPLEYYRAALRHGPRILSLDLPPIAAPLLALHGAEDGCLLPPGPDDARWFAGEHEQRTLPGVGHFLHVEQPAAIAALVSEWLSRSFRRS